MKKETPPLVVEDVEKLARSLVDTTDTGRRLMLEIQTRNLPLPLPKTA